MPTISDISKNESASDVQSSRTKAHEGQEILRVYVRDEDGNELPGTQIICIRDGNASLLGQTDNNGFLQIRWKAFLGGTSIRACHTGYVPELKTIEDDSAIVELHFALSKGGLIKGTVNFQKRPFPNAFVIASTKSTMPSLNAVRTVIRGGISTDPSLLVTKSDEAGRFELNEVKPGGMVALVAGAPGFSSLSQVNGVVDKGNVTIDLGVLYAATVEIRARGGGAIQAARNLREGAGSVSKHMPSHFGASSMNAALAGVDINPTNRDPLNPAFLLMAEERSEQIGPVTYYCAVPGYKRTTLELFLESVDRGIAHYKLEVDQDDVDRFFQLHITIGDLPKFVHSLFQSPGAHSTISLGTLELQSRTRPQRKYVTSVRYSEYPNIDICGVPADSYILTFQSDLRQLKSRSYILQIDNEDVTLPIDLSASSFGSIAITCYERNGTKYVGPAVIELIHVDKDGDRQGFGTVFFEQAPYGFPFIGEGLFEIRFRPLWIHRAHAAASTRIGIMANALNNLELTIEDPEK
jgi:hypothetical protein